MRTLLAVSAVALLAAGCATTESTRLAQAECKVAPITTAGVAGRPRPVAPIEQRYAEMQLAASDLRVGNLQRRGLANNTVEDALRDCQR